MQRLTPPDIRARKGGEKIVMLTAYTTPFARALDAHVDALLVGDSLGMALYGMDSTLGVTLDMMINHGAAVMRGSKHACVIVDMPFGSYQQSPAQAFASAARVMAETGASAVKLEGGQEMEETIAFLTARGIPVMGHVGLMPQRAASLGGYKAQGKTPEAREAVLADARGVERAGAFSLVVEAVMEPLARHMTEELHIPVIGIGGSPACDGQVLVTEDMAGLTTGKLARFVKQYGQLAPALSEAAASYAREVKNGIFPAREHCYGEKA